MRKSTVNFARKLRREQSDAERNLWSRLRNGHFAEIKFRRQEPIGQYIVDFVSFDKKLIIEIDGSQHADMAATKKEARRTAWLESQGFNVMRFWDNDVLLNIEGVLLQIQEFLK